jgi:hypothetical protein
VCLPAMIVTFTMRLCLAPRRSLPLRGSRCRCPRPWSSAQPTRGRPRGGTQLRVFQFQQATRRAGATSQPHLNSAAPSEVKESGGADAVSPSRDLRAPCSKPLDRLGPHTLEERCRARRRGAPSAFRGVPLSAEQVFAFNQALTRRSSTARQPCIAQQRRSRCCHPMPVCVLTWH